MQPQWIYAAGGTRRLMLGVVASLLLVSCRALAELREMNTDRPDATESPFTVDADHWQLEMDFATYTRNHVDGGHTREWDIAPLNLRVGLNSQVEAGLFISPYNRVTEKARDNSRATHAGFGDVTLRTKFNFAGDDGKGSAYGLIADWKIPTAATGLGNGRFEGDLILPFATDLPGGWDFGAMTKVDLRHRENGRAQGVWINTATIGHDLWRNVAGYVELTSAAGDGSHVATFDFGFAWKVDSNTQLDLGANVGISRAADDLEIFSGLSRRF